MDIELYKKYGNYNHDGFFIESHKKWDFYANNPKLYKKQKRKAKRYMLIPIIGIIFSVQIYEDMGLSLI